MILQPCSAELTRIHYYDRNKSERNWAITPISRQIDNNNVVIKKNVFGQHWVLKISENRDIKKKSKARVVIYVLVICSLICAVFCGILFSVGKNNL